MLALAAVMLLLTESIVAQPVPCWFVPNGLNVTMQCANGYWITTTPDGEVFDGNGHTDPNATARGSGLTLNPRIGRDPMVSPPTQIIPTHEPGQAERYGLPPRQD